MGTWSTEAFYVLGLSLMKFYKVAGVVGGGRHNLVEVALKECANKSSNHRTHPDYSSVAENFLREP